MNSDTTVVTKLFAKTANNDVLVICYMDIDSKTTCHEKIYTA